MNDFQEGWLEGFNAATIYVIGLLLTKCGPEGVKLAPKVLAIEPPYPPSESQVERVVIGGENEDG